MKRGDTLMFRKIAGNSIFVSRLLNKKGKNKYFKKLQLHSKS